MDKQALARRIIEHALPLVPFDGWTLNTLKAASRAANIPEEHLSLIFPNAPMDAVEYWIKQTDEDMSQSANSQFSSLRIPEKVTQLIIDRFKRLQTHREAVRRASHMFMLPWNLARGTKVTFRTVDAIWKLTGVTDSDFNWYTRRATLAYVYTTTFKYWLTDEGADIEKTIAYLKRRLNDAASFSRAAKHFKLA